MDGLNTSTAQLNLLDGSTPSGIVNEKAVIYGANGEVNATKLQLSGNDITATAEKLNILTNVITTSDEINLLDGAGTGTIVDGKAVIYGTNGEVNATKLQIGGSDITSTAAELNILDGVTVTKDKINLLDGVSAGNIKNSTAVIYGSNGEVNVKTLKIDSVSVNVGA